jgi:predicted TPR repeat methyltransferase
VFSVEALEDSGQRYHLKYHGRYAHTRAYLDACLRSTGFTPLHIESVVLRMEVSRPVQGWVVVARKAATQAL